MEKKRNARSILLCGVCINKPLVRNRDPIVLNTTQRRKLTPGAFKKLLKVEMYMQILY